MTDLPLRLWKQTLSTIQLVRLPAVWVPLAVGLATLIASLLIVPGEEPSFWNWIGLPAIALFGALAILADTSRHRPRTSPIEKNNLLLIAVLALVVAVTLSFFTSWIGTAVFVLALCLIAAIALRSRRTRHVSIVLTGMIALLVPIWTWIALDADTPGLLLLAPLGILAWFSDVYMRAALDSDTRESIRRARSFRFLSWLGLLSATILTTMLAISSDVHNGWAVVAALGAVCCIGADAGLPQHASLPGTWSRQLIALGFAWLGLFWLTSL
jgi:hypothetical protein